MTKFKQIIAGTTLFAVSSLVAASAAFAHDGTSLQPSYTYSNAEDCSIPATGAPTPSQTTDVGYPADGYAADCNHVQGQDSTQISATAHVLANCFITGVENTTASVRIGDTAGPIATKSNEQPGNDTTVPSNDNTPGTLLASVTSFDFPTQTTGGGVNSDTLKVTADCDAAWQLDATIDGDFAKVSDATTVKGADTFGVAVANTAPIGDNSTEQDFTGAGDTKSLGTYAAFNTDSDEFHFRSNQGAPEAGDYHGSFTLTVTALD